MQDIALAGLVGDQDAPDITDLFRGDMLIGQGIALDCRHMDATLMGKGGSANVGLIFIVGQICQLVDKASHLGKPGQLLGSGEGIAHLQGQGRDN